MQATSLDLPATIGTTLAHGQFLNPATAQQPVAVLGADAAERMGIDRIWPGERIWLVGQVASDTGSTSPASSTPPCSPPRSTPRSSSDSPPRSTTSASTATPPQIYLRAATDQVTAVHDVLAATANPENPSQVTVSQPSDALVAQAEAKGALNSLFLGLGAISLLVGAIGVGNVMLISVLERRSEIGLRRALGATKGHIRAQFLTEAILLALAGGIAGVGLGALSTAIYAHTKHWTTVIPAVAWAGGAGGRTRSSAPSPDCYPPSAPPACPPPRPCGACDAASPGA